VIFIENSFSFFLWENLWIHKLALQHLILIAVLDLALFFLAAAERLSADVILALLEEETHLESPSPGSSLAQVPPVTTFTQPGLYHLLT
jgi:hypothetical protein